MVGGELQTIVYRRNMKSPIVAPAIRRIGLGMPILISVVTVQWPSDYGLPIGIVDLAERLNQSHLDTAYSRYCPDAYSCIRHHLNFPMRKSTRPSQ